MENRTYLSTENHLLFETNNSLASFWLLGLNDRALSKLKNDCLKLDELMGFDEEEEEWVEEQIQKLGLGEVTLSINSYRSQLKENESYISEVYPELDRLFAEFYQTIEREQANGEKKILMNLFGYGAFYDSYQDFFKDISHLFQQLKERSRLNLIFDQDVIASTIGFDMYSEHSEKKAIVADVDLVKKSKRRSKIGKWLSKLIKN
ncbi:MAG: hypothetical protein ACLTXM_16770 [Enterococcus sp.]